MICQLCLNKPSTIHLAERLPSGSFAEAHYCAECYEAMYLKPQSSTDLFPRPRFTLNNIMMLVAVWAVANAVTAWVMKSGYITGTPQQLREWTVNAFLAVNLVFGFCVVWFYLMTWLQKVSWYKRTGGLVPTPKKLSPRQQLAACLVVVLLLAWFLVAIYLEALAHAQDMADSTVEHRLARPHHVGTLDSIRHSEPVQEPCSARAHPIGVELGVTHRATAQDSGDHVDPGVGCCQSF